MAAAATLCSKTAASTGADEAIIWWKVLAYEAVGLIHAIGRSIALLILYQALSISAPGSVLLAPLAIS
jgi:hypothetical protein